MIPSQTTILLSFIIAICILIVYDFYKTSHSLKIQKEEVKPVITNKKPNPLNTLPPQRETYAINTLI